MKVISIALSLCAVSGLAMAQEAFRDWEVSGGYQYMRADLASLPAQMNLLTESTGIPNFNIPPKLNANGFNASLQENMNSWFGGVFDFSAAFPSLTMNVTPQVLAAGIVPTVTNAAFTAIGKAQLYTFLFGPQFTLRRSSHVEPFVRVMVGGAHGRVDTSLIENGAKLLDTVTGDTSVAFSGGGGVDIRITDRVYFRIAADLVRTELFNDTQENIRATAAITYRIGGR
jgi:opacity protein-like surface antigen